jgi:hypothetical protein
MPLSQPGVLCEGDLSGPLLRCETTATGRDRARPGYRRKSPLAPSQRLQLRPEFFFGPRHAGVWPAPEPNASRLRGSFRSRSGKAAGAHELLG